MQSIGVIGGGAWGTALAATAAQAGRAVTLWAREPEVVSAINETHENAVFLPGVTLDPSIRATDELATAADADVLLLVSPAQHLRHVSRDIAAITDASVPLVICSKGIEQDSLMLMSAVLEETAPSHPVAVLSGPTFADEVALAKPSAVTLAAADDPLGQSLVEALGHAYFRPYQSHDVIGAQVGGAVKNVLAIAAGIVAGAGLGNNAAAALITRGLAEIVRLGLVLGGERETMMGLSGLGDLVLTCSSTQSRNMSLGKALGEGRALEDVLGERKSVAEGVFSASAVAALADRHDIDMPICAAMDRVLNHGSSVAQEITALLNRPFRAESL